MATFSESSHTPMDPSLTATRSTCEARCFTTALPSLTVDVHDCQMVLFFDGIQLSFEHSPSDASAPFAAALQSLNDSLETRPSLMDSLEWKFKMSVNTRFVKYVMTMLLLVVLAYPVQGQEEIVTSVEVADGQVNVEMMREDQTRWPFFADIEVPPADDSITSVTTPQLVDFFATSDVFEHARPDLSDLRIYTADGNTVPYALRILSPKSVRDVFSAIEFNRSEPDDGVHELTLDLERDDIEHNEVLVETTGTNFRRSVEISGSADAKDWKPLVSGHVIQFKSGEQALMNQSFQYPNSRHRYLRVQVTPDPQAIDGNDTFTFQSASVIRQLDVPGQPVTTEAVMSNREPTRQYGAPGSRWILDFGAAIPCDRLEVIVQDDEFARDISLEEESLNGLGQPEFYPVYVSGGTEWRRVRGEPAAPMVVTFPEIRSRRLRLTVADYRNKPLTLGSVQGSGAARQIIFERLENSKLPVKLYFGNHEAETANYDFARNLPDSLKADPFRVSVSAAESNPEFVPAPKAFTERFPWLVYVALSSVSLVLGVVIMNLSKAAIANHDAAVDVM